MKTSAQAICLKQPSEELSTNMMPSTAWVMRHPARCDKPKRYYILRTAYARGLDGCTLATTDYLRTPGYEKAYIAGAKTRRRVLGLQPFSNV